MIRLLAIVAALLVGLISSAQVRAQASETYPIVETSVSPTSGTVGDRFQLTIKATAPSVSDLKLLPMFDIQTTWTKLGEPVVTDSKRSGSGQTRTVVYTMVPFETGRQDVPQVAVTYSASAATSNTVMSKPLWVEINSVLSGDGSASALRDVKPPVSLPLPPVVVWSGYALVLVIFLAIGWWLWRRYADRWKRLLGSALTPPELALKQMEALETERLVEQKKIKEYYTRLIDSVRQYLEAAFDVPAMDLTSTELLHEMDMRTTEEPADYLNRYRQAMARLVELSDEADMVKFARLLPEPARCRRALQSGRDIVELTRYKFQPAKENENASTKPGTGQPGHAPQSGVAES